MLTIRIVTSGLGLGNTLLKQADDFILIDMKGIVLCVIEMRLGMNFIYCFNVTH